MIPFPFVFEEKEANEVLTYLRLKTGKGNWGKGADTIPETAILGVGAIIDKPVVTKGKILAEIKTNT